LTKLIGFVALGCLAFETFLTGLQTEFIRHTLSTNCKAH